MFSFMKYSAAAAALLLVVVLAGCSSPQTVVAEPWTYLVVQLENSWNDRDIALMEDCYRYDFQHHLLEEDWDDFDGDGIIDQYWGLDLELAFAQDCFSAADSIYFDLRSGTVVDSLWGGDTTEVAMAMHRDLVREIYTPGDTTVEVHPVLLVASPGSNGKWHIWRWFDEE